MKPSGDNALSINKHGSAAFCIPSNISVEIVGCLPRQDSEVPTMTIDSQAKILG